MPRTIHTLTLLLLGLPILVGAPLRAADLLDIYQIAAHRDARLQAAQAGFEASEEARPQALSALLPQVTLSAQYGREQLEASVSSDIGGIRVPQGTQSATFNSHGYTLRLDQIIYDHARIVRLRQSGSRIAQAQARLDAVAQTLILRVSNAYFSILGAQDNLQFAMAEKKAIYRQLEQARQRFEVGIIAITDVKEALAAYDLAVAQQVAAKNQLAVSREGLLVITGQFVGHLSKLGNRIPLLAPDPANIEKWVATAVEQNLQLMAAQFATETASLEVQRRSAGHYPTLGLFAEKSDQDAGGIFGPQETDQETIGIQLNVPLFSGGFVSSRTDQANFLFQRAQRLQEQQRREIVRQTRASYLNVMAGISRVKALAQALESNRASAKAARAGFAVGTRTSLDVLVALRDLFRTKRDLARARYLYLVNTLRLKQAAGTLTGQDLVDLNTWLVSLAPFHYHQFLDAG
jgi:outer membrane protein